MLTTFVKYHVEAQHAAAVAQQPWLDDFTCEGQLAGTVLVHPYGVGTPPFAIEYSQVGTSLAGYISRRR